MKTKIQLGCIIAMAVMVAPSQAQEKTNETATKEIKLNGVKFGDGESVKLKTTAAKPIRVKPSITKPSVTKARGMKSRDIDVEEVGVGKAARSSMIDKLQHGYPSHFYASGGAGVSRLSPKSRRAGVSVSDKQDMSKNVAVGYQLNRKVQMELFHQDFGAAEISVAQPDGSIKKGSIGYKATGVSGRYNKPISKTLDAFVKGGVAKLENDEKDVNYHQNSDTLWMGGAGVEMRHSDKVSSTAEFKYYAEDIQALEVGVNFEFY